MSEDGYDDYDDVPLQHKKPFGSGLRRNEIKFVPASSEDPKVSEKSAGNSQGKSISDFYLNMVLKKPDPSAQAARVVDADDGATTVEEVCEICKIPLTSKPAGSNTDPRGAKQPSRHEASIAHQVCLAHSHPPSALDRNRMGLAVLASQGWDPDARTGLGAAGQGVQYPVKAKPKDDHLGVGVVVPKDFRVKKDQERPKLLDAKKVRKMAADDRRRTDKLQQQIFGRVDLERYLGPGA